MGSGTTLVEAKALDRASVGVDSNPVAVLVSSAKTCVLDKASFASLDRLNKAIEADISRVTGQLALATLLAEEITPTAPPEIPNRDRWFTAQAMHELGLIMARIQNLDVEPAATVARACFSAVVVQASNQDSETRYTSKPREADPGDILHRFRDEITRHGENAL